jgi:exodeoxyribonuclease VII small subunit
MQGVELGPEPTMDNSTAKFADIKDMTFERALKELETIVGRLERGDVELEESIAIYERGEALKDHCDRLLKQAEAKVEKLTLNPSGVPTGTEPFRPE